MPAVCDQLAKAITELANVERFDGELAQWKTVLQDALYGLEDAARNLRVYNDGLTYDAGALDAVEQRLEQLNRLKRKYADSLAGVIAYGEKVAQEIEFIENSAELAAKLQIDLADSAAKYRSVAEQLTAARRRTASILEEQIQVQLADLGLDSALFAVQVKSRADSRPHSLGQDEVEFMFSANRGGSQTTH